MNKAVEDFVLSMGDRGDLQHSRVHRLRPGIGRPSRLSSGQDKYHTTARNSLAQLTGSKADRSTAEVGLSIRKRVDESDRDYI